MIWPLYRYPDRTPGCTLNLFRRGVHDGVDLGYPWRAGDPLGPPDTDQHGRWTMPAAVPALAVADGVIVYSQGRRRGWAIRIRCHQPAVDFCYFHGQQGSALVRDGVVKAGQELFLVGADPTDREGWRHLHFEMRAPCTSDTPSVDGYQCFAIDPWPWLREASMMDSPWPAEPEPDAA